MDLPSGFPNFSSVLTVGEAADYLGVSTATLRNWDRNGKLKSRRHPQNGYRIYLHEDLANVLRSANLWTRDGAQSRQFDWAHVGETEHIVQFYETDSFLTDTIADFVASALVGGGASVIIATSQHRRALPPKLRSRGVDIRAAVDDGRYVVLDAAKTLAKLMTGDMPDAGKFATVMGGLVDQLAQRPAASRVRGNGGAVVGRRQSRCGHSAGAPVERIGAHAAVRAVVRVSDGRLRRAG